MATYGTDPKGGGSYLFGERLTSTQMNNLLAWVRNLDAQVLVNQASGSSFAPDITAMRVDVQTFTGSGTWTKPSNAQAVQFVAIGGGGGGEDDTASSAGGGGGSSGALVTRALDAAMLPATLTVVTGSAGAGNGTDGGDTTITGTGISIVAAGGVTATSISGATAPDGGANGGAGGSSVDGSDGTSLVGTGGSGGTDASGSPVGQGSPGYGWGAGGGGGGGSSGGGGGGGGGGLGGVLHATTGSDTYGGDGAPGVVVITTWRKQ